MTGPPKTIGRYEIRRQLGRGMMGVVYEAVDTVLHRTIALKTIEVAYAITSDEREAFERRFLTEARAAAGLTHPNIVVVHDVGRDVDTGTLFMALEYLQGRTLAEVLASGNALEWRKALRITALVAAALQAAHRQGIVHRDIKPANIMLLPSGEPKIMDFGIAKVQASELTAAGQVFGTPSFMSPEQALGKPLDGRTDLFSLGTVLYQLLTGHKAFPGENLPQILALVIRKDPPPPSHVVPSIPPTVDYVTARVLAKAPDDRYPDARALAEDIEDVLAGLPPRHLGTSTFPVHAEGTLATTSPVVESALGFGPRGSTQAEVEEALDHLVTSAKTIVAPSTETGPSIPGRSSAEPRPPGPPLASGEPRLVRTGVVLGLGTALGAAAAAMFVWWVGHTTGPVIPPAPGPPATESRIIAPPSLSPAATPPPDTRPELAPTAAPTLSPVGARSEPAPRGTPPPKTVAPPPTARPPTPVALAPTAQKPPAPPAAPTTPTQLLIDFEHPLKTGSLRVWVDGALVLDQDLEGRVSKEVAGLRIHKGKIKHTLPVLPGRHEVRIRVAWEDNVKTEVLAGTFKEGSARLLEVRLGRILKNLSLEWK
jgi:serine/threonine protein kinase